MCHPEFEHGRLRERPLTVNRGFQSGPSLKNKGDFGTKNNKLRYIFKMGVFWSSPGQKSGTKKCIFLKREVFRSGPGQKSEWLEGAQAEKWGGGFRAAHTCTALIWENPPPIPSPLPSELSSSP